MLVAWSVKEDKRVVSRYILEIDVAVYVNELSWGKGEKRGTIKAGHTCGNGNVHCVRVQSRPEHAGAEIQHPQSARGPVPWYGRAA